MTEDRGSLHPGELRHRAIHLERGAAAVPVPEQNGSFLGSVLYSYKLNWQTVLFAGYGDDRLLLEDDQLVRTGRSLFFKVSYAFIR